LNENEEYVKVEILFLEVENTISSTNISSNEDRIIIFGEDFPQLPHGSVVDLVGYFEDGLVFMTGEISLATEYQINLRILKTNDKENRRKFIRVKAHNKIILLKAYSMGRCRKEYSINEVVETRDINLGGLGFYSNRRLLLKQKILMDFSFLKPGLHVEAMILRAEKNLGSLNYRYKYGCFFINRNSEEERIVCEYVFKMQIENHRRIMLSKAEKED
jgi:hypothetical protein